jgi:predicted O-methyltransferase YrrM
MTNLPNPIDDKNWRYVESQYLEPEPCRLARERAIELQTHVVSPATGAALQFLMKIANAQNIVEVGTGTAGAAYWIASAIGKSGQITSIDAEGQHYKYAKEMLADFDNSTRVRLINGKPLEVLPRLSDQSYDAVVISEHSDVLPQIIEEAIRMVSVGGLVVLLNALGDQKVGDLTQRDQKTVNLRLAVQAVLKDNRLESNLLTVGDGILVMRVIGHEFIKPETSTI